MYWERVCFSTPKPRICLQCEQSFVCRNATYSRTNILQFRPRQRRLGERLGPWGWYEAYEGIFDVAETWVECYCLCREAVALFGWSCKPFAISVFVRGFLFSVMMSIAYISLTFPARHVLMQFIIFPRKFCEISWLAELTLKSPCTRFCSSRYCTTSISGSPALRFPRTRPTPAFSQHLSPAAPLKSRVFVPVSLPDTQLDKQTTKSWADGCSFEQSNDMAQRERHNSMGSVGIDYPRKRTAIAVRRITMWNKEG